MSRIFSLPVKFYLANHGVSNSELLCKKLSWNTGSKSSANCSNGMVRNLRLVVALTDYMLPSLNSVLCIFSFISKAKVCRIYAEGGIA